MPCNNTERVWEVTITTQTVYELSAATRCGNKYPGGKQQSRYRAAQGRNDLLRTVHELSTHTVGMKKLPAEKVREGDIFRKN